MHRLKKLMSNPFLAYDYAAGKGFTNWVPDEVHLKLMYRAAIGSWPDFKRPNTFNEKLQWLKLHDRNPLYTKLVDKYRVKKWVADRIGEEHVTRTYGAWEKTEDIDISGLPERFVLKTNHDCGGIAICRDRGSFDFEAAKKKLDRHLKTNYFWRTREWPYKNVTPCIFAEEYLEPGPSGDLPDYKLFHFSKGRIITLLMTDRFTEAGLAKTFFDEEWRPLDLSEGEHLTRKDLPVPERFDEMKAFAGRLAERFPFARVDFYESKGRLLFGELTFYPNSGFELFDPSDWDVTFGSWIELPNGGWLLVSESALLWAHTEREGFALSHEGLTDYKLMCFGGRAGCSFACTGRAEGDLRVDFFDREWRRLPFTRHYPNADAILPRPQRYDEMVALAEILSRNIPFVRVDFYESGDRLLFGEMTFFPGSGFEEFDPFEWDETLGSWIDLSGAYGANVA